MFFMECDRADLIGTQQSGYTPPKDLLEVFIKRRRDSMNHLKDFRKQQMSRMQWRHNRYDMMKGIKSFHKSTKGKKFHRQMARFLASRIPLGKNSMMGLRDVRESAHFSFLAELQEFFKALTSYKTHLWLVADNFMTLSEAVDYELFMDSALRSISDVESELLGSSPRLSEGDVDFLLATLDESVLLDELGVEGDFQALKGSFSEALDKHSKSEYPYLSALLEVKESNERAP